MSDQQPIPKDLEGVKFIEALGLTIDDFKTADALNAKLFPNMSDAYKKAGETYITKMGPSGTFLFSFLMKFYQEVYSKMEIKEIKDDVMTKFINDNYGPKSPMASLNLWLVKPDFFLETISLLKVALRLSKPLFDLSVPVAKGPSKSDEDRSTFEPERFGKKLGIYVGASFGIVLLLGFMALSPSLIMNDFIYKPPMMRIILGLYASLCFIFIIPYYVFIGLANNAAAPYKYTLFPIATRESYEWSISNYFFGRNGYIPTLWTPDEGVIKQMTWLREKPHPKDLDPIPITLESILG
jgi:hypothetical protein